MAEDNQNKTSNGKGWTGLRGKTLWDWLLLIGPVSGLSLIALAAFALSAQIASQREVEAEELREATYRGYLDQMTSLIMEHGLADADTGDSVAVIASAATLGVLPGLDGTRKGLIVQFLYKSRLIGAPSFLFVLERKEAIVLLEGADLSGAVLTDADLRTANLTDVDLSGASLGKADLAGADLTGAKLSGANMIEADLSGARLSKADMRGATLRDSNLIGILLSNTDLRGADLSRAEMRGSLLSWADLGEANLSGTNLRGTTFIRPNLKEADLSQADMSGARNLTDEELAQASSLLGATLPDGTKIETEKQEQEFKRMHGDST